ncbi:hypothetical protein BC835DRAFT_1307812 [Cytidiella melzeri]|nr:hypothetical protein BC835DRAFT_1307812 [Cytidiella melzeri]
MHATESKLTASAALLLYDYLITLQREITTVWSRNCRPATILFLLNRYLSIIYGLLLTVADQSGGQTSCAVITRLFQVVSQLLTVMFALFSALRVYAIWNRSNCLFTVILALNLLPVGVNIYVHAKETLKFEALPFANTCVSRSQLNPMLLDGIIRGSRVAVIFGDALVLTFTWWKTLSIRREASSAHIRVTLTFLLIRDGTIFFFSLLALNLVQAILVENMEVPGYMMAPVNV